MSQEGLTFKDVSQRAGVSLVTAYRMAQRQSPKFVTDHAVRIGKILGFTQKQVEHKIRQDRLRNDHSYGRREAFYKLIGKLVDLFESK